jgi:LacI family repressor for deo operon, udp, cdd, tsx, nupC, and nupG
MKTFVTIRQVAEEAGVSIQTVSRVINARYDVASETRQRVQAAIDRLGYKPNAIARGLASRRSRTLGFVAFDFTDIFFAHVLSGAEQAAQELGYVLMLGSVHTNPEEEPKYLRLLTEHHVEGVLFARQTSVEPHNDPLIAVNNGQVPIVLTGFHDAGKTLNAVDVDNVCGSRAAMECLLEAGHRRVGIITGPLISLGANDRLRGAQDALESAGIGYDPALVVEGYYDHASGYAAAKRLLDGNRHLTALLAQNDRMAIGAMRAAREAGLRVPDDISVIGYDDIPDAAFCCPPLTTIWQPSAELGRAALQLLVQQIEQPGLPAEQLLLPTELVWRESVKKVR